MLPVITFITCSPKIAVYLQKASPSKPEGPSVLEKASFIRLSFRRGGQQEVGCYIVVCPGVDSDLVSLLLCYFY